jgi:hypothetical protein
MASWAPGFAGAQAESDSGPKCAARLARALLDRTCERSSPMSIRNALRASSQPPPAPASGAALAVARSCRRAYLAFLAGAKDGWTKHELAAWLVTSYAPLAVLGPARKAGTSVWPTSTTPLELHRIERLMAEVRDEVLDVLWRLQGASESFDVFFDVALEDLALERDPCSGAAFFVPIDRPDMTLARRVLSLVAADYLARSDEYTTALHVCPTCAAVRFELDAESEACGACNRTSDITAIRRDGASSTTRYSIIPGRDDACNE